MRLYLTALIPTDAVTHGLLPASARLGLETVVLTDRADRHREAYRDLDCPPVVVEADVRDAGAVAARVHDLAPRFGAPSALMSNSDHLQAATALAAELLGLPAKPWAAAVRCKNKALTRAVLAAAGLDVVRCAQLDPGMSCVDGLAVPFPAVVKPREGVASEDALLVADLAELTARVAEIRARRPAATLVVEEYLAGDVRTYETLGDGESLYHFGSWRTTLGPPPHFAETRLDWDPRLPPAVEAHLRAQLAALGVGLGACHTEFVIDGDRARIVEVNYRLIGDTMDLICADLLGVDLFAELIRLHQGQRLPAGLPDPVRLPRHARVDYVRADRAGVLVEAPADQEFTVDGVRLGHRRMREVGVTADLHGTNRDYLAAVHAIGPDRSIVDTVVDGFLAERRWVIEPVAAA
ncbi:ATP-grasp domain-containing protein [Actinokineospora xionganensis]|uniref:Siderophore biosynthesis protein n=1 Tax=Actinokineospora xionganensis TaxID=2684470 RepID=A0ABR7L8B7_9PSEU|nr:siderophore biosynthesis protein [Actinokineospora xionganensis]MBC6448949.1 siderophore biosynthesis protein [Actinokineospora xionganensis]